MDVAGYYELQGQRLESCASCKYFFPVTKFPHFPMPDFDGQISEKSELSVCSVWSDDESVREMVPCAADVMCELYTKRTV